MVDIYLRALEPEDFETTHRWRNNAADGDLLVGMKRYVSKDTERRWVLNAINKHEKGEEFRFAVCDKDSKKLIGLLSATEIDYHNGTFETSSMIGESDWRRKGAATEARVKFLEYMFNEARMNKAVSLIIEDNIPSIRSVEKFGFMKEGVLRQAVFKSGEYKDVVVYGMLKEEFVCARSQR